MKGKRYSQDFRDQILKDVEEVKNVVVVAKKYGLPHSTVHTWLRKRDKKIDFTRPAKNETDALMLENKKLKKITLDQETKIKILEDLLKKTYQVWETN